MHLIYIYWLSVIYLYIAVHFGVMLFMMTSKIVYAAKTSKAIVKMVQSFFGWESCHFKSPINNGDILLSQFRRKMKVCKCIFLMKSNQVLNSCWSLDYHLEVTSSGGVGCKILLSWNIHLWKLFAPFPIKLILLGEGRWRKWTNSEHIPNKTFRRLGCQEVALMEY